jgi:hypothetical protein
MANESMTDEKRARLEAIRAANRNRKAAETGEETAVPATAETPPSTDVSMPAAAQPAVAGAAMPDEKAERLAAIRAANAAKKTAAPPETAAPAASGATTPDEKAERLAAIRAANAAKKTAAPPEAAAAAPPASPAAPAAPKAVPKPAIPAASPAAKTPPPGQMATPSSRPLTAQAIAIRTIFGALCGMLLLGLLATTVGNILPALIFGALTGAVVGYMFGSWPPSPGDETTE